MPILLAPTTLPPPDNQNSARFFAEMFGLEYKGVNGHFAPVFVNDSLTFDFDNRDSFESHHYAFYTNDEEFDAILGRVKGAGRQFGSGPMTPTDGKINTRRGGRGFYFPDLDGH